MIHWTPRDTLTRVKPRVHAVWSYPESVTVVLIIAEFWYLLTQVGDPPRLPLVERVVNREGEQVGLRP